MATKRAGFAVVGLAVAGAIGYAFVPNPVSVDVGQVVEGPLQVTVDHEGKTRIRDRYVVSSPLAGRLQRIELKPGAVVEAGKTLLAAIEPSDPVLLDARTRAETEARFKAAEAAGRQAETNVERARAALEFSQAELSRKRTLAERQNISQQELDEIQWLVRTRTEELRAAEFAVQIAAFELEQARAALPRPQTQDGNAEEYWKYEIRSPIDGQVLRVMQESAGYVSPATELLELGDSRELEVVVDVLSSDAVKIRPGAKVFLEHWGGERPLNARVRLVEPSGFTKISALGVEEQRVNVIVDFDDPFDQRATLKDAFRVEARILIWEDERVVKAPASAVYRHGDQFAVFVFEAGRARRRVIEAGQRNALEVQVLSGLKPGDTVIVHPSDKVTDGVKVAPRPAQP